MKRKTRGKDTLVKKIHRKQLIKETKGKVCVCVCVCVRERRERERERERAMNFFCRWPEGSKFKKLRRQSPRPQPLPPELNPNTCWTDSDNHTSRS